MAHHGRHPFDDEEKSAMDDFKEELLGGEAKDSSPNSDSPAFGATGRHPEGKLTEDDEGEIHFGVAEKDGKVVLDFGKKVHWIAATPEQAKDLAGSLLNKARKAKG